jgi:quercetin dioxygenase-like cupin family protein
MMEVAKATPARIFNSCGVNVQVFDLERGEGTLLHDHPYSHDILVVSGEIEVMIGGDNMTKVLVGGDVFRFPTGAIHNFVALIPSRVLSMCHEKDLLL